MSSLEHLESQIGKAMKADRYRFRRALAGIRRAEAAGKPLDRSLGRLAADVERSVALRQTRRQSVPKIEYDDDLPVSGKRHDIAAAIREHQVVVLCG